jgi:hypothetical protein
MHGTFDKDTHNEVRVGLTFSEHPDCIGQRPNWIGLIRRCLFRQCSELSDLGLPREML